MIVHCDSVAMALLLNHKLFAVLDEDALGILVDTLAGEVINVTSSFFLNDIGA